MHGVPFVLQPGGCHIQFQNLEAEFTAGEVLPLQIILEKAGICISPFLFCRSPNPTRFDGYE